MISLASEIRTRVGEKLSRNVSLVKMHNSLSELFVDRTSIDTSLGRFFKFDKDAPRYYHCLCLNDERTIKFHQSTKQDSYVFDEQRQIWIDEYIDPIKEDYFIPRDDAQ